LSFSRTEFPTTKHEQQPLGRRGRAKPATGAFQAGTALHQHFFQSSTKSFFIVLRIKHERLMKPLL